jgi:NTE family protein
VTRGAKKAPRPARLGLALGAGGARGLAHIGVLRELEARGIEVGAIAGTSSGALVGAMYAAGHLEEFEERVRALEWHDVLALFDPVWPRAGLMSGTRAIERLAGSIGDWRIEDLPIPFAAVAVDLITGDEVWIREGRILDAVRASISIPGILVPHRHGRRLLVDGALRNPVPVSALPSLGASLRVAVNLHQSPVREIAPPGDRERFRMPGPARLADLVEGGLARLRRRRSGEENGGPEASGPNLFDVMIASMSVLEFELAQHRLAREPADLVIEPDVRGIRAFDFHKASRAIKAGRAAAAPQLESLERLITARQPRRFGRPR